MDVWLPPDIRLDEAKHDHAEHRPSAGIKGLPLHLLLVRPQLTSRCWREPSRRAATVNCSLGMEREEKYQHAKRDSCRAPQHPILLELKIHSQGKNSTSYYTCDSRIRKQSAQDSIYAMLQSTNTVLPRKFPVPSRQSLGRDSLRPSATGATIQALLVLLCTAGCATYEPTAIILASSPAHALSSRYYICPSPVRARLRRNRTHRRPYGAVRRDCCTPGPFPCGESGYGCGRPALRLR